MGGSTQIAIARVYLQVWISLNVNTIYLLQPTNEGKQGLAGSVKDDGRIHTLK